MINISNISKAYDDKVIFDDFSLKIEAGDFVVLSGKSGCGKTTLLNIISGIEPYSGGDVVIAGNSIKSKIHLLKCYREEFAFIFQNFALVENKTVRQNLNLVHKKYRSNVDMRKILADLGIEDKIDTLVYKLSGGEQQRVAIARVLYKKCNIILADEPTGSLDKENEGMIIDYLKKFHQDGKTIILVTHADSLKDIGNRVIEL